MFNIKTNHENPPNNSIIFEEYFGEYLNTYSPKLNREYLPVYWTNYYISKNYGQDDMSDLQTYLDLLDTSKKYFTVVQWDDGILNNVDHLDLFSFSSGGIGDYPIPLSSNFLFDAPNIANKQILFNFIGAIFGRHKVRETMYKELKNKPNTIITDKRYDYPIYLSAMNQSVFSLCPRGYGKTSFRIYESLMCKSIPVYIYDSPWIPYFDEFEEYGVLCDINDISNLYDKLISMSSSEIDTKIKNGSKVFIEKYTYRGIANQIVSKIGEDNEN
jgi:glycosyltransferase involved in cell wall biosynthesis